MINKKLLIATSVTALFLGGCLDSATGESQREANGDTSMLKVEKIVEKVAEKKDDTAKAAPAQKAAAPVEASGEVNVAACAGCHGASFEKKAMGVSKIVSEMSGADIVASLKGYKDGTYGGGMKALMTGQVAGLDDAAMEAIGAKFGKGGATEAPAEKTEEAPKEEAPVEKTEEAPATETAAAPAVELNVAACAGCHGANFEKKAMNVSKVVSEMSKADIVTAMKGYKDGTYGGGMKALMKGQAMSFDDAAIEALAAKFGK